MKPIENMELSLPDEQILKTPCLPAYTDLL